MAVLAYTTGVDGKTNLIKTRSINNVILVTTLRLKPGSDFYPSPVRRCDGYSSRKSHSPLHTHKSGFNSTTYFGFCSPKLLTSYTRVRVYSVCAYLRWHSHSVVETHGGNNCACSSGDTSTRRCFLVYSRRI
ncbi:unnamed protein product [Aphis gossypii]|uniref:Uncharacterized protein n=1 Tax=Aphis gossypii TaxID=80765 RepID=A0A9P0IXS7_APHGO|nr:unnamed protein product [Aphis gossypii]